METPPTLNLTEEAKLFLVDPSNGLLNVWKDEIETSSNGFWHALTQGYFPVSKICTNPLATLTYEELLWLEQTIFNNIELNRWA